ncbi:hypothetical protein [Photobacterium sp. 1_MG-2023]|uniref:hypothetical protein n=1 Tax=Photobacterium sp. 1_MG-2023 TaxID=3062646 RepID=UPI0026E37BC1|nr:hypothetical protein [Photobacterium sp. 1_MG-2023]MDO6707072.1 hypothetical protein [Photobacterium sp. 1_MG-2023]
MMYRHSILFVLITAGLVGLQGCSSGENDENAAAEAATSPFDKTQTIYLPVRTDKTPGTKNIAFQFTNLAYFREGLQYDNPAQFTIFDDGSWEYYAENIVNRKITGDDTGSGGAWTQTFYVKYYSDWDQYKRQCAGTIIHSQNYDLVTAKYNVELKNYSKKGIDDSFKQKLPGIRCIDAFQQWHK